MITTLTTSQQQTLDRIASMGGWVTVGYFDNSPARHADRDALLAAGLIRLADNDRVYELTGGTR